VFPLIENSGDLRFLVHQSQAGCVIGKGGEKIKDLRTVIENFRISLLQKINRQIIIYFYFI
jgi:predicted RNA-binding protein YlqC (UPF0109 family)